MFYIIGSVPDHCLSFYFRITYQMRTSRSCAQQPLPLALKRTGRNHKAQHGGTRILFIKLLFLVSDPKEISPSHRSSPLFVWRRIHHRRFEAGPKVIVGPFHLLRIVPHNMYLFADVMALSLPVCIHGLVEEVTLLHVFAYFWATSPCQGADSPISQCIYLMKFIFPFTLEPKAGKKLKAVTFSSK